MSRPDDIETLLEELIESIAAQLGVELYDLVFRRAGPRWKLQVFIDRAGASVSLDDCEKMSRQLSRELDVLDPIPHAYDLEVSSPGLERSLRRSRHWEQARGQKVKVRWRDEAGKVRSDLALLEAIEDSKLRLRDAGGRTFEVPLSCVLAGRMHVDW